MKQRCKGVPSDAAHLPVLTEFLREFWSAADLPPAQAAAFELALEEVFMNVVMHGSPAGTTPWVEVSLSLTADAAGHRIRPLVESEETYRRVDEEMW